MFEEYSVSVQMRVAAMEVGRTKDGQYIARELAVYRASVALQGLTMQGTLFPPPLH